MTAFFGFGATPPRWRGSLLAWARSLMVPSCIAPHACATAPGSRPVGCLADVGPEGHPPCLGRIFRACTQPGTGPVLHPLRHTSHHTTPESSRTPGDPAVPGWIFSHRSSVFPSSGDSFGVPHPGTYMASCLAPLPGRRAAYRAWPRPRLGACCNSCWQRATFISHICSARGGPWRPLTTRYSDLTNAR